MPRLSPLSTLAALAAALLLAGCQLTAPGAASAGGDGVTPNAVAGDAIEVTTLDAPLPADPMGETAAPPPAAAGTQAPMQPEAPPAADPTPPADPAPVPAAAEGSAEAAEAPPPELKSERQIACEREGGTWARTGSGDLRICVYSTRDGGKRCTRESDCEGLCLARSGTCAPIRPLLGCNEILQDNGARVTQCIE